MRATASALPLLLAAASVAGCASAAVSPSSSSWVAPYAASWAPTDIAPEASFPAALPPLAFAAPPVQAADTEFDRGGLYLGAYGIKSYENFDDGGGVDTGNSDIGVGLKLGFRTGRFLAIEGIVESVDGFEVEAGNVSSDLELLQYGAQAKFFLLGGRIQPYGLVGLGITSADVSGFSLENDGGYVRIGLGADLYLTSNFAAFGELNYNQGTGSTDDIRHTDLLLGVLFRF